MFDFSELQDLLEESEETAQNVDDIQKEEDLSKNGNWIQL